MTTPDAQWENGMFYRKVAPRFPNSSKSLLSKAHHEARNEVNHRIDEIIERLGCARSPTDCPDATAQEAIEGNQERKGWNRFLGIGDFT